jgi:oxygen-independent coproporphyrinogen-3 oxidase
MAGLYVHIPYCRVKCPYCDFNVYGGTTWPEDRYADALVAEIRQAARTAPWIALPIDTIFFGGGTPSLFAPESIARVIAGVRDYFVVRDDAEISLEANPGTIDRNGLARLRSAGVNRLSIGIQSFRDGELTALGRDHTAAEASTAVDLARTIGFDVVGADLMFGIPGQGLRDWEDNLRCAIALGPEHVSAYGLTYEHDTPYHAWRNSGRIQPVTESVETDMFIETERILEAAGYEHYEISNYARPGWQCRHNLTYWRRQPYLGIGAGAHGFAATPPYGRRFENVRLPKHYMALVEEHGHGIATTEDVSREQAIGEYLFLGLRLRAGIDRAAFSELFGTSPDDARPSMASLIQSALLEHVGEQIRLTPSGLLQADFVCAALM